MPFVADSPEEPITTTAWGSQQHKKRTRQKGKPPTIEQPSDQAAKDQSQEDWVIL